MTRAGIVDIIENLEEPQLARLNRVLALLFPDGKYHLDHDPPLAARQFNPKTGKYKPDANDPNHLFYRAPEGHRVKTYIRGEHGQYSDVALIKRERRRAKPKKKRPKPLRKTYPFGCYPCPTIADALHAWRRLERARYYGSITKKDYRLVKRHIEQRLAALESAR